VFFFQRVLNAGAADDIATRCRTGRLGCVEDKADMARHLNAFLAPIRERRARLAAKPELIDEIVSDGTQRARSVAMKTLADVKSAIGL
jgi:tryptophanyl-tRNA synthetase